MIILLIAAKINSKITKSTIFWKDFPKSIINLFITIYHWLLAYERYSVVIDFLRAFFKFIYERERWHKLQYEKLKLQN